MAKSKAQPTPPHKIYAGIHKAAEAELAQGAKSVPIWERRTKNFKRSETTIHGHAVTADDNSTVIATKLADAFTVMCHRQQDSFFQLTQILRPPLTQASTESESEGL